MSATGLEISDSQACRRYFGKFSEITRSFDKLAAEMSLDPTAESSLNDLEIPVIEDYLQRLSNSFTALSVKYLLTGLVDSKLPSRLAIDQKDSGFPLFQEIIQMASDSDEAEKRLALLPERETLKARILDDALQQRRLPRHHQFEMSQRVYYEMLASVPLFHTKLTPELVALGSRGTQSRGYFCHWSVYDTQRNLPNVYLMYLEDSGERPLARDEARRERVWQHLMAQSLSSLQLLTIARGFDKDFPDLHPKVFKRLHIGPMYSNTFTRHADVVQDILAESDAEPGQDWVLCWTLETLRSKATEKTSTGIFSSVQTEIYDVDPQVPEQVASGVSSLERGMLLPYRPYQRLVERDVAQLRPVRKYVVGPDGMILRRA